MKIDFIYILFIVLGFLGCNNPSETRTKVVFTDSINANDYLFVNTELSEFQFPVINQQLVKLKYKQVLKGTNEQPVSYYVYAGKILPNKQSELKTFLNQQKMLVPMPLGENILFRFKLSDSDNFNINHMHLSYSKAPEFSVNELDSADSMINTSQGFYYFQDLTVYRDIKKNKRKFNNGKLIIVDFQNNMLIFYKDQVHYK